MWNYLTPFDVKDPNEWARPSFPAHALAEVQVPTLHSSLPVNPQWSFVPLNVEKIHSFPPSLFTLRWCR